MIEQNQFYFYFRLKLNGEPGLVLAAIVFVERDHALFLLVPEVVEDAFEAFQKGDLGGHLLKDRVLFVAFRQVVVRHQRVEVVDMVVADIARQPMENARQFIITAPFDGRRDIVPFFDPFLIGLFVLVLDIKEPDGDGAESDQDRHMYQQRHLPADDRTFAACL